MGLLDLSTSASSKKHVDFSDARYQLADKLKASGKDNIRSTFTLYDNKDYRKVAVQDISAAYALSDKKLPVGEILNKMLDLIIDMEDNILDTEKDAIYAWRYSMTLLSMYEDKTKRQGVLNSFDNGLKNAVIGSKTFIDRYPGKYTNRTNFFDPKVKSGMEVDITTTFREFALPKIHDIAIAQSKAIAEKHNNPILDKIVHWAIENYNCTVDSFFDIKKTEETGLYYSVNTIILHLKNGYDMSIIGTVGTDRDDQFAISILNANDLTMTKHGERLAQQDIKSSLTEASKEDPVDPLTKLLSFEKKKNETLRKQFEILKDTRPMIPADVLSLKAAETVVGRDYIWGCEQFRKTHEDLPKDFKLSDVELPELEEYDRKEELTQSITDVAKSIDMSVQESENDKKEVVKQTQISEQAIEEVVKPIVAPVKVEENSFNNDQKQDTSAQNVESLPDNDSKKEDKDLLGLIMPPDDLFAPQEEKIIEEKAFGAPERTEFTMPTLPGNGSAAHFDVANTAEKEFDASSTLLPGFIPPKKVEAPTGPSITQNAQPIPQQIQQIGENKTPLFKPVAEEIAKPKADQEQEEIQQPALILDNLDSLFD